MRQCAVAMARASSDAIFLKKVLCRLVHDEDARLRAWAHEQLRGATG